MPSTNPATVLAEPDDHTLLRTIALTRFLPARTATCLARQGVTSLADIACRSDREITDLHAIGDEGLIRLRTAVTAILADAPTPVTIKIPAWDQLDTVDLDNDVLLRIDGITSLNRDHLAHCAIQDAGLGDEIRGSLTILSCRTLLDIGRLSRRVIRSFTPDAFTQIRARLIQTLGDTPYVIDQADETDHCDPAPQGERVPVSILVPLSLRIPLMRIPLITLVLPDRVYQGMITDTLATGYDLACREIDAVASRYRIGPDDLAKLTQSLQARLSARLTRDLVAAQIGDRPSLAAWLGTSVNPSTVWMRLTREQRQALSFRPVRANEAGLTPLAADQLIAAGFTTLAAAANATKTQVAALTGYAPAALDHLKARWRILSDLSESPIADDAQDIDTLRQHGLGADVCNTLALAGLATIGQARNADLTAIPGLPADLIGSIHRALGPPATPDTHDTPCERNPLLPITPEVRAWLEQQSISALIGPGFGKGRVHRLRQNGFQHLAAIADADRASLVAIKRLGEYGATTLVARLTAILMDTPLETTMNREAA